MKMKDIIYHDYRNAEFYADRQNGCAESLEGQRKRKPANTNIKKFPLDKDGTI